MQSSFDLPFGAFLPRGVADVSASGASRLT